MAVVGWVFVIGVALFVLWWLVNAVTGMLWIKSLRLNRVQQQAFLNIVRWV